MTTVTVSQRGESAASNSDSGVNPERGKPKANWGRRVSWLIILGFVAYSVVAWIDSGITIERFIKEWRHVENFFNRALPMDFPPLDEILWLSAQTLAIVIGGTLLAALLSLPLSIAAAANTGRTAFGRGLARFLTVVARAAPDVVLVMIFGLLIGGGPIAGIIALGLHSVGMIAKMFADAIEQVDEGPVTALRAAGATKSQQFWSGIFPQVLPAFIAVVLHRTDINLRVSAILGYVGIPGLGLAMFLSIGSFSYDCLLALAFIMLLLCLSFEVFSSFIRSRLLGVSSISTKKSFADRIVGLSGSFTQSKTAKPRRGAGSVQTGSEAAERGSAGFLAQNDTTAPVSGQQPGSVKAPALTSSGRVKTTAAQRRRPWTVQRAGTWLGILVMLAVIVASLWLSISTHNWSALQHFWESLEYKWNMMWPTYLKPENEEKLLPEVIKTINMAMAASFLTLVVSFVLGALSARNVAPNGTIRSIARTITVFIRAIPELLLALIFVIIFGLGPIAGILALGIGGIGLLAKLFADSLEEVNPGPERALRATGATKLQVFFSATLPQVMPAFVAHYLYSLDTKIRGATLLGIVGAGGIGYMLQMSNSVSQHQLLLLLGVILMLVFVLELISMFIRKHIR